MSRYLTGAEAADLVRAAAGGDAQSWEALVDGYGDLIVAIARNHRLSADDAADVSQTTWLRLVESISRITDPTKVCAWLATTTRHECLRVLARSKKLPVSDSSELLLELVADDQPDVDAELLDRERDDDVQRVLDQLPLRSQGLIHLLMADPPPSYQEISAVTGMPMGSIGPTRGRLLHKVELLLAAQNEAAGSSARARTLSDSPRQDRGTRASAA